ncbi:hypothetical protein DRQ26_05540 [bacterium]|nr:MAG: hypothetical protein DRQ26_05540 [bacterium]
MKCDEIKALLVGYLDDEIDSEQRRRVEEHILHCKECAAEIEEMRKIREVLRKMSEPKMPDAFWQRYWNGIYNRIERQMGWILFSIGAIVLLVFAFYRLVQNFFLDPQVSIMPKLGIGIIALGAIVLIVSIFREKIFAMRNERYKEVER